MFSKRKRVRTLPQPKIAALFNDMIDDHEDEVVNTGKTPMGPPIQSQHTNLADEGVTNSETHYKIKKGDFDFLENIDDEIDNIFDSITNLPTSYDIYADDDECGLPEPEDMKRCLSDGQRKTYQYLVEMNIENVTTDKLLQTAAMFGHNTEAAINYLMFDDPDDNDQLIAEPDFLTAISRSTKVDKQDRIINNDEDNIDEDGDILNIENNNNGQTLMGYIDNDIIIAQKSVTLMGYIDDDKDDNKEKEEIGMINKTSITLMGVAKGQLNTVENSNQHQTLMGFCDENEKLNVDIQLKK